MRGTGSRAARILSPIGKSSCAKRLRTTASATARVAGGLKCRPKVTRLAAGVSAACSKPTGYGPNSPARLRPTPPIPTRPLFMRRPQPLARPARPHRPGPGVGGRHHLPASPGRRLALPGRVARPLLAQSHRLGRARDHARRPGQRGPAPVLGRAPPPGGPIVHSDQGSQYTATRFKDLIA